MKYLLYDDECPFCCKIIKNLSPLIKDPAISHIALRSNKGKEIISQYSLQNYTSVIYIDNNKNVFTKASAILNICKIMRWPYKAFYILNIIPASLLDIIYDFIARNRMHINI